jgi:UrcA family protein
VPHEFKTRVAYASAMLATILASNCPVAGAVESNYPVTQRIVSFADLDITAPAGASMLYARITDAAQAVCEPSVRIEYQRLLSEVRKCRKQAIDRAVADVNAPGLTSYHQIKTMSVGDGK